MKTLTIIGGGRVGRTMGRLFHYCGLFSIAQVVCRSEDRAKEAVEFIGAGEAADAGATLRAADVFMLTVPDGEIEAACVRVASLLKPGDIVFHCSGTRSSRDLHSATARGAWVASVHPNKSFADPETSVSTFNGTFCGIEGDAEALAVIGPAFEFCGGTLLPLHTETKALYHAGAVFASNYLVTLMEFSLRCYEQAGVPREVAVDVIKPMMVGTIANVESMGTRAALTGPIARGDLKTVAAHVASLEAWNAEVAACYRQLAEATTSFAKGVVPVAGSPDERDARM